MYLLSELGQVKLEDDVKEVLSYLFERIGYGNVTNDACDYDNGKKGLKKTKETDRSVRWVKKPVEFKETDDDWEAVGGEEKYILVPNSGYVELTNDGSYNPETGTPFSTLETREDAEQSWINRGFSQQFARLAVSYFCSREEGDGTGAVSRGYFNFDFGRFFVDAVDGPDDRYSYFGSFPASRSLSRAKPDSERTYEDGLRDGKNQAIDEIQRFLQGLKE